MTVEIDPSGATPPAPGSQRERDLEAKLHKRTLWVGLFAFIALTELIIMVEVLRQAS